MTNTQEVSRGDQDHRVWVPPGQDRALTPVEQLLLAQQRWQSAGGWIEPSAAKVSTSVQQGSIVEVRFLGPVEIAGAARPLDRSPRLTELVVYLATHPAGVTSDTWATALWPDRRVPFQTLANRLSDPDISAG
jgi:hypothetical protein